MTGRLYGVGVGPGDPELITLKALRVLREADVIAYPALEEGDSLARAIAAPHIPKGREEFAIRMPMLADRFPAMEVYDQAAERISKALEDGKSVAVLCEGDPFFYGSFMYLFGRLADRHPVEVVPGVSSLTACAAALSAPLAATTRRWKLGCNKRTRPPSSRSAVISPVCEHCWTASASPTAPTMWSARPWRASEFCRCVPWMSRRSRISR